MTTPVPRRRHTMRRVPSASWLLATSCLVFGGCTGTGPASLGARAHGEPPRWASGDRAAMPTMVVPIIDVLFAPGSATLPANASRSAATVAGLMREHPGLRVRIEGHTDERGASAGNCSLSARRARAFADALVRAGIDAARIETRAQGETDPLASNATALGRAQNRRLDIAFSDTSGRFPPAGPDRAPTCRRAG